MLRRFIGGAASASRMAFVAVPAHTRRSYVTDAPEDAEGAQQAPAHTVEKMWGLWNEGNLFSLSPADLTAFLNAQQVTIDPKWKKAALVRQVEELLQANELKAKQNKSSSPAAAAAGGAASASDAGGAAAAAAAAYGGWDKDASTKGDMLLDLHQTGFYQGDAQAAPRAFQVLIDGAATDMVVSRINTTSFPGFPSSTECYTLTGADADQASKARFLKTMKWCSINLRTLQLDGQFHVEFGKLVLKPEAVRKGKRVVSAWTLQQRLQASAPYHWVSCAADASTAAIESFLSENGFEKGEKAKVTFDVSIRRAKDSLAVVLNSKGATISVNRQWEKLQSSHFTRSGGPDIRFLFRARKAASTEDMQTYTKAPIVDVVSENVQVLLSPELGEVLYCSENETRTWTRPLATGGAVTVTQIKRQPIVISRDEEDGERLEYALDVDIPRDATDINDVASEVLALAKKIAALSQEGFVEQFQTEAKSPSLEAE